MTDLERKNSTPASILNSSQELHYHSGYNKKTLERDVLKWWKAVLENGRKMAPLLSSTFWEPKWIFIQQSVHCGLPDTRGQSVCREQGHLPRLGEGLTGVRRPDEAWGEHAGSLAASTTLAKYEQVRRRMIRISKHVSSMNKVAHAREQFELTTFGWIKKKKKIHCKPEGRLEWSSCGKWVTWVPILTHFQPPNNEYYLGSQGDEHNPPAHQICYIWRMRENFKNPWAINQSQSSRTVWQSAHIIGRQARIRYAFSGARSKLESQLTLLIALSYLIWKTMGIEEEAFTISSFCHDSEGLRLPPCFHFN